MGELVLNSSHGFPFFPSFVAGIPSIWRRFKFRCHFAPFCPIWPFKSVFRWPLGHGAGTEPAGAEWAATVIYIYMVRRCHEAWQEATVVKILKCDCSDQRPISMPHWPSVQSKSDCPAIGAREKVKSQQVKSQRVKFQRVKFQRRHYEGITMANVPRNNRGRTSCNSHKYRTPNGRRPVILISVRP